MTRRRPLMGARRDGAERYLFLAIAGFALSVAGTRWFLDLTGYPKVGGGGLHIAHVLWGGLLLVVAATLPLVFVGRRMLVVSAIAGGVGVGLFIDEIGKFLTETNDYFFAPAAPMIYGALLLLVAAWVAVRRGRAGRGSDHDALQASVEAVRAGIDGDLTAHERDRVAALLERVAAEGDPADAALARRQAELLASPEVEARLVAPGWVESGRARALVDRFLPRRLERALIILGLIGAVLLAILSALVLAVVLGASVPLSLPEAEGPVQFPTEPVWTILTFVVALGVGAASGVAVALILARREGLGLSIAIGATLVNLVAGGLLTFYVAQFGAMADTIGHLLLLALLLDYRSRRVVDR
jgi:hypothetical protein